MKKPEGPEDIYLCANAGFGAAVGDLITAEAPCSPWFPGRYTVRVIARWPNGVGVDPVFVAVDETGTVRRIRVADNPRLPSDAERTRAP